MKYAVLCVPAAWHPPVSGTQPLQTSLCARQEVWCFKQEPVTVMGGHWRIGRWVRVCVCVREREREREVHHHCKKHA
jgi:hypothetical protein